MAEINIVNERVLTDHPLKESIGLMCEKKDDDPRACDKMIGYLRAVANDDEFWDSIKVKTEEGGKMSNKKVFIVHGHDKMAKIEVARFIEKFGLEAIILHEQPNSGKTIIEKIEANSDVQYAVVLYTPCDMGRAKEEGVNEEKERARQNVVFEHGYLIGKLGRDKVSALVKGDIEKPGDISGVVYISMDDAGAWKTELAREMKSIGLEVDMNKL
ncbi:DNA-binding protein [Ruminococcus sp. AF18-22]|nr:DNA-binding protein [Ruminococcus sp. AF18-22]